MQQPFDVVQEETQPRRGLRRMALLHVPLAIASGAAVLWLLTLLLGGETGAIVGLTIFGLVLFATAFQSVTALRDLRAEPTRTTGIVLRKRRPGIFLMLGRTHYLRLREGAFVVSVPAYHELSEDDEVEIDHWPHTRTVIRVRLLRRAADIEADEAALAELAAIDGEAEDGAGQAGPAQPWRPPHLR
jgi:hypothetical protein